MRLWDISSVDRLAECFQNATTDSILCSLVDTQWRNSAFNCLANVQVACLFLLHVHAVYPGFRPGESQSSRRYSFSAGLFKSISGIYDGRVRLLSPDLRCCLASNRKGRGGGEGGLKKEIKENK